jgi:hypothetical protein
MMLLDLAGSRVASTPVKPLEAAPVDASERLNAAWEAQKLRGWWGLTQMAPHTAYEDAREAFRRAGLPVPQNPYDASPDERTDPLTDLSQRAFRAATGSPTRASLTEAYRAAAAKAREQFPDLADTFPDPFELEAQAQRRARAAQQRLDEAEAGGTGVGTWLAGAAGGMAAAILTDPLQLVTLPIGAPSNLAGSTALRVLKAAAIEGGVAAAAQAASTTLNRQAQLAAGITPDPLADIALAGAGGAVLGGGMRAAVEGWRAMRARGAVNPEADQAASVAQAWEMAQAGDPGGGAPNAHATAMDQALGDAAAGRPTAASGLPPVAAPDAAQRLAGLNPTDLRVHVGTVIDGIITAQAGVRQDGAWRSDLGAITVEWGQAGNPLRQHRGGFGISHIIARRNAEGNDGEEWVRTVLPDVLLQGRVAAVYGPPDGLRVDLVWQNHQASLSLYRNGQRETWVVTGFPQNGGPGGTGGVNPAPPYAPAPSGIQAPAGARPPSPIIGGPAARFQTFTAAGRGILVEPRVVELDTLVPSNLDDFTPNPAYPHREGVQPRDRSRESDQQWVRETASSINPELLGRSATADAGAPIVGPDNVVESGNGRIMALRRAAREHPEVWANYQAWLADQGFDLAAYRQPVLVMDRISALTATERALFVTEANAPTAARMSAAETARADAGRLDDILDLHQGGDVGQARNVDFARAFLASLPRSEANALRTADGQLSVDGLRRLRAALLARAYGDQAGPLLERMLENADTDIKAIAGALEDVSAEWARMRVLAARGLLPGDPDRTADLLSAVRAVEHARGTGPRVDDWLASGDFFDPTRGLSDRAMAFLAGFFRDDAAPFSRAAGRDTVTARLRSYADAAIATRQVDMFTPAPGRAEGPQDAPNAPAGTMRPETDADAPAPRPGAPDPIPANVQAARAALADAAVPPPKDADAALFLDAQRAAAAGDFTVPTESGASMGARQLLDEAEDAAAQAAQAGACLVGGAAT